VGGTAGQRPAARTGTKGRTPIVVVDDDRASLELAGRVLEGAGWHVLEADDAAAALKLIGRSGALYVLTDIHMPGMSGVELARAVKEDHPAVRLVAMTAYAADLDEALAAGMFEGVIEKPVDVTRLPGTLDWLFLRRHLV